MPEITWFGWFHTIVAIVGILFGIYALAKDKFILADQVSGKVYLLCTFIAAVTALMIYRHGGFGPAHGLAVLTLLALAAGLLVTRISFLSGVAVYFQTFCFSGTLLFHMIPAVTDGLLRLPVNDPFLDSPEDPLLRQLYLVLVGLFIFGYILQFVSLRRRAGLQPVAE